MNHQPKPKNHFFRTSLLLSILFHLLIIKTFIFVFPIVNESHKPRFVFLGSILNNKDISNISFNKPPTQTMKASNEFAYHQTISTKNPYKKPPIKPPLQNASMINEKKSTKITFEITPEIIEPETSEDNKQKIDEKYEKYIPLRYYLK